MSSFGTEKIEQIIVTYADMIYRVALQNLKNRADAEDIFQEVCLSLLTADAPIGDEAHLKNWLIRVTINKCNNFHNSFWNRNREPLSDTLMSLPDENKELFEEILRLPKTYRNIIYLYYYEGYQINEIAEILGMNRNTVGSYLRRARQKLKTNLTEGGNNYGYEPI